LALYLAAVWLCMVMSLWGCTLALRARSQQVGPLIQNGVFLAVFLSTAYTPQVLLQGWLAEFAKYNPVSYVLEMARQATVTGIEPSWAHTWPGLLALTGMTLVLGGFALRELGRMGE
jgi:ABC-2 type transport system permease protein